MNTQTAGSTLGRVAGLLVAASMAGCVSNPPKHDSMDYRPVTPLAIPAPEQNTGAIYQAGHEIILFEDRKARRVGDLITIVLSESTNATKKASTTTQKDNAISVTNPTVFGNSVQLKQNKNANFDLPFANKSFDLGMNLESSRNFTGAGDSNQSNTLSGTITVSIAQVMPNGNLVVRGEKWLQLNQGEEYIQISGIVRADDVTPSNTVSSTLVADAHITYAGKGAVADTNAQGWLSRFFISSLMPF